MRVFSRAMRLFPLIILLATAAQGAAPVIVNSQPERWLETPSLSGPSPVAVVTFLVTHDVTASITGLAVDRDYDGIDNTASVAPIFLTPQRLPGVFHQSRLTAFIPLSEPAGFSCPAFGGAVRRLDVPLRIRVVDSLGQRSATVSNLVHFVENTNCSAVPDYPRIYNQSQNMSAAQPGQSVSFQFFADDPDPDVFSSDDDADAIEWRLRSLTDGSLSAPALLGGMNDNSLTTLNVIMPRRGRFVVEARVRNENGTFPDPGAWWRLGAVDVNSATPPALSLFAPPSVNAGDSLIVTASASDGADAPAGGRVQVIEWDADGDGVFERREFTSETQNLTSAMLQQPVNTSGFGLKVVSARVTDNGAMSASDNIRRVSTDSIQVRVNAIPIASDQTVQATEDTPAALVLAGADPDDQPAQLTFQIVSLPQHGTLACSGATCTYTPQPNFNGNDSFTFRTADGPAGTAWAFSNAATVSIIVAAVNDPPQAGDVSLSTDEDVAATFTVPATDVDSPDLTITPSAPQHGSVSCASTCTYTPDPDFHGTDSFTYRATDSDGAFDEGVVMVTVAPVNDSPVAVDGNLATDEDTAVEFALPASDVDGDTLSGMASGAAHGEAICGGATCTYTPHENFFGSDAFTIVIADGNGGMATSTVSVTIHPVNDAPTIQCSNDVERDTDAGTCSASPGISATATDVEDGTLIATCSRSDGAPAGSPFALGVTTVTCSVVDLQGASASCSYTVEVRDATMPVVTASLTPAGPVRGSWGNFRVSFTADDNCSISDSVAVMSVPAAVRDFTVRLANGGPSTVVRIDLDRREISLAGKNDAEKAALLAQIMSEGGLRVTDGQTMRIDDDRQGRALEFRFESGVLTRMQAPVAELRVTARDVYGNVAIATATAAFE